MKPSKAERVKPGVGCWFEGRPGAGPCGGEIQRAHWIRQQVLRREIGALAVACPRCGAPAGQRCMSGRAPVHGERRLELQAVVWDPRVWAPMCEAHHRALDHARTLRVDRADLPPGVEAFAREYDATRRGEPLQAWLDMEYGPIESEAA